MKFRKRKHKKASIELSMNFMVMVILSLVMLGVGFYFAKNIFVHTQDIGAQLDAQTKTQIESKLRDPASLVAVGLNRKIIKRGDHETFGVGVANRNKEKGYFYLEVKCVLGNTKDSEGHNVDIPTTNCDPDEEEERCCGDWIQATKFSDGSSQIGVLYYFPENRG